MILLDTHTAVWLASDQSKLSEEAKKTIFRHTDNLHISVVSVKRVGVRLGLLAYFMGPQ
jgi:PIN domain nuclease of toxin-antitoxin system